MRIVAYCVSTVGKSGVVSAEYLLSFWESGILVHNSAPQRPWAQSKELPRRRHFTCYCCWKEEFSLFLWPHCRRILGSLSLVSSGLLSTCLFLGYFWFASFHVLNLSHEYDSVPSYVGHGVIVEAPQCSTERHCKTLSHSCIPQSYFFPFSYFFVIYVLISKW